jgi:rubrerythrin
MLLEESVMTVPFNADEIFEMAGQIERNGAKFYHRAADLSGDDGTRKLLLGLAEWEEAHERHFEELRKESGGAQVELPGGEVSMYLRAMADGRVFDVQADPSAGLTGKETIEQILRIAIGLEKESIVFYVGVREMIPGVGGRERVEAIIHEEMRHIAELDKRLAG